MSSYTAALMPLTSHVLPQGRMALRIFEPRYVRMVKESMKGDRPFVMCMLNARGDKENNSHIFQLGSSVTIVDFDQGSDGFLGITVEASQLVEIDDIATEDDGLRVGRCKPLDIIAGDANNIEEIGKKLESVFQSYPELASLYDNLFFEDPFWVTMRWLELLPISSAQKQSLLYQRDLGRVVSYLEDLIE